jgi:predicted dehydrogenase
LSAQFEVASYVPDWHPYENYGELYAVRKAMGGGVVLTESHELDLAFWFFGRPHKVAAVGGKLTDHEGDAEDTAQILLDCGFPVSVSMCFMQRPARRSIRIGFEKGRLEWEGGETLRIHEANPGGSTEFHARGHERDHLFRDQMKHFLACVRGEAAPLVDVKAGWESLDMALNALEQIRK